MRSQAFSRCIEGVLQDLLRRHHEKTSPSMIEWPFMLMWTLSLNWSIRGRWYNTLSQGLKAHWFSPSPLSCKLQHHLEMEACVHCKGIVPILGPSPEDEMGGRKADNTHCTLHAHLRQRNRPLAQDSGALKWPSCTCKKDAQSAVTKYLLSFVVNF